jgi:hypothetical protein
MQPIATPHPHRCPKIPAPVTFEALGISVAFDERQFLILQQLMKKKSLMSNLPFLILILKRVNTVIALFYLCLQKFCKSSGHNNLLFSFLRRGVSDNFSYTERCSFG